MHPHGYARELQSVTMDTRALMGSFLEVREHASDEQFRFEPLQRLCTHAIILYLAYQFECAEELATFREHQASLAEASHHTAVPPAPRSLKSCPADS